MAGGLRPGRCRLDDNSRWVVVPYVSRRSGELAGAARTSLRTVESERGWVPMRVWVRSTAGQYMRAVCYARRGIIGLARGDVRRVLDVAQCKCGAGAGVSSVPARCRPSGERASMRRTAIVHVRDGWRHVEQWEMRRNRRLVAGAGPRLLRGGGAGAVRSGGRGRRVRTGEPYVARHAGGERALRIEGSSVPPPPSVRNGLRPGAHAPSPGARRERAAMPQRFLLR